MTVALRAKAWGTTIFCDDIRFEFQGTMSLIGVYNSIMYIGADLPVNIPKLGMLIKFFEVPDMLSGSGSLRVYAPGKEEPIFRQELQFGKDRAIANLSSEESDKKGLDKTITMQMPLVFSPFEILEEGEIKIRVYVEEEEFRIGALSILRAPTLSTVSPQPPSPPPPAAPAS